MEKKIAFDVAKSSSEDIIALAGDDIQLFDWQWKKQGNSIPTLTTDYYISLSPQKNIAIDDKAKIWDSQGREKLELPEQTIKMIRFSQDGQLIATANSDGTIKIWNLSGKTIKIIKTGQKAILDIRFASNNQQLATSWENGKVLLFDFLDEKSQLFERTDAVTTINFNPVTGDLIAASNDKTATLWHQNGQLVTSFVGHEGSVNSAIFSEDGQMLVTASSDRKVILWNKVDRLDLESQRVKGCSWLSDYLNLRKTIMACH